MFVPSKYQLAIFEAVRLREKNILVNAVAGSGKTTSMEHALKHVPPSERVIALAFNASIAAELQKRVPSGAMASTINSVGHRTWMAATQRGARVDAAKVRVLARTVVPFHDREVTSDVVALVQKAKVHGLVPKMALDVRPELQPLMADTDDNWLAIAARYNIELPAMHARVLNFARTVLAQSALNKAIIDFDDQLYMPVIYGVNFEKFDRILVDEVQDLSDIQMTMIRRMGTENTRYLLVGDRRQALYQFRGADSKAMDRLKTEFNCIELPLSVTYRCPLKVVQVARSYEPAIEARPGAPEGIVRNGGHYFSADYQPGDMVVCRRALPVITLAYALLGRKIKVRVQGRDLAEGLKSLVRKLKASSVANLIEKLKAWETRQVELLRAADEEEKIEGITDKTGTLRTVITSSEANTVEQVEAAIENLFSGDGPCVLLSTVHRCVDSSTFVDTQQFGISAIKDIPGRGMVDTASGLRAYVNKATLEEKSGLKITTRSGYSITVTPEHGLLSWRSNEHIRVNADKLIVGDWLRLKLGTNVVMTSLIRLPKNNAAAQKPQATIYGTPDILTDEVAEFFGLMVADGTVYKKGFRIKKFYQSVIDRAGALINATFCGTSAKNKPDAAGLPMVEVSSTQLASWLLLVGGMAPNNKFVPQCVLSSPLYVQAAFLKGLFEDGTVNEVDGHIDHVHFENKSHDVTGVVQQMLLRQGIVSSRRYHNRVSSLYIYGQNAYKFKQKIGFIAPEKNARLIGSYASERGHSVPISAKELAELRPFTTKHTRGNGLHRGSLSRRTVGDLLAASGSKAPGGLADRLTWHYEKVTSIEKVVCSPMCVEVPDGGRFLQNGFDGFNSKGLESDRVFVIDNDFTPRWIKSDDQLEAERNIKYVAVTRAKQELVFVSTKAIATEEATPLAQQALALGARGEYIKQAAFGEALAVPALQGATAALAQRDDASFAATAAKVEAQTSQTMVAEAEFALGVPLKKKAVRKKKVAVKKADG